MISGFISIINSIASIITVVEFLKILGGKLLGTKKELLKKKEAH